MRASEVVWVWSLGARGCERPANDTGQRNRSPSIDSQERNDTPACPPGSMLQHAPSFQRQLQRQSQLGIFEIVAEQVTDVMEPVEQRVAVQMEPSCRF